MSTYVTIMLTDSCNLKCQHCYKQQKNTICDVNKAKEFILAEHPIAVILFGGEPMLDKTLDIVEELVAFCQERSILRFMSSNLTYELTDRRINIIKNLSDFNTSFNIKRWQTTEQYELWLKNAIRIRQENIKDISCACTLDKHLVSYDPERVHTLLQSLPFWQFCLEPYIGLDKAKNEEIDNWLCKYYEISKNDRVADFLFTSIFAKFKGQTISARFDSNCWKASKVLHTDGHITCCPISQIDITNGRDVLNNLYAHKQKCLDCKWFKYCEGICPMMIDDPDYCHGYPKLYELMYNDFQNGFCR